MQLMIFLLTLVVFSSPTISMAQTKGKAPEKQKSASLSKTQFIEVLKKHQLISAGVAYVQKGAGASNCTYDLSKFSEPSQMQKGSTYDFSLQVQCASKPSDDDPTGGTMGSLSVEGTWFMESETQDLKLSTGFAG